MRWKRNYEEQHTVKVVVYEKEVFGSCLPGKSYEDDDLLAVRDFLNECLKDIPPEYHTTSKFAIDSVGGYEGEHHAELQIYYERPETKKEREARHAEWRRQDAAEEAEDRAAYAQLKARFEATSAPAEPS